MDVRGFKLQVYWVSYFFQTQRSREEGSGNCTLPAGPCVPIALGALLVYTDLAVE